MPSTVAQYEARAATDHERLERALAGAQAPFALVDIDAFWHNGADMLRRAAGKPIRVASKSIRARQLLERILGAGTGFRGILAYSLPEALWLADRGFDDVVVGYPATDSLSIAELGRMTSERPEAAPVLMVDCPDHLDLIESAASAASAPIRVCLDLDVSWWAAGGRIKLGPKRSPVRTPRQALDLARDIDSRTGVRLVGLMAYEGQVAGVGDSPPGKRLRGRLVRTIQRRSMSEIAERRGAAVAAVSEVADLQFVNGGGTGSLHLTTEERAVTELAAGSGFFAPTLFDAYSAFALRPAAMFALPIVRKPADDVATALGGGYPASGPGEWSRLPQPHVPAGLRLDAHEGAGEVQTPLVGEAARGLRVGDRVYFRHAKAGELCERFDTLHLVSGERVVDEVPTYRGEGRCFL